MPLHPRGLRAVRARAVDRRGARRATARSRAGRSVENDHVDGILRLTRAPAPGLDAALQARAEACIRPLLEALDYVGVCCVELFDVGGELLANEMAPRVHNSGHWTIEGADTSQFENHLRAVLGLAARLDRGARRERDGELHRRDARPRRRARDPGRAPPRLRQGAAAGPQGRARHRHRRRRRPRSTIRSTRVQALVDACARRLTDARRSGDRAGLAQLRHLGRRRRPSRPAPRRCAGPATAPNAAPRRSCARSAARARAAARRRVR